MIVAIAGATGGLGGVAFDALVAAGHDVRPIGRSGPGDCVRVCDLLSWESVAQAIEGADILVNCAGKKAGADVAEVNEGIAESISRASATTGIPVVNYSSLSVYGDTNLDVVTESARCRPVTSYGQSKLKAEQAFADAGACAVHLRIGNVFTESGFQSSAGSFVRRALRAGEISSMVFSEDVAAATVFLVGLDFRTWPKSLNIVRPGIGLFEYSRLFESIGLQSVPTIPPIVPHLIRLSRGVRSLPATTVYSSASLVGLGFAFPPLAEVAPSGWNLKSPADGDPLAGLRVLLATDSIDLKLGAGTATRTLNVARGLSAAGAQASVVSMSPHLAEAGESEIGEIHSTVLRAWATRFWVPLDVLGLPELVRNHDVLHLTGHWSLLNIALARIAEREGVPYFVCPAGSLRVWGRSRALKRLFDVAVGARFIRKASGWVAVVEDELPDFAAHRIPPELVSVIPNGAQEVTDPVAAEAIEGMRSQGQLSRPYVLFLGRLNAIKGPDLLLEAFAKVFDDVDFDLVLAGPDVGLGEQLQDRVSGDGSLADRVHLTGFVDGEDKERLLSGCEALVVPSRKEAMSTVVIEAALRNKPVLATTECGLGDLLESGGGQAVAPDVDELAQGLAFLQNSDLQAMGRELNQSVKGRFGWDRIADLYRKLFSDFSHSSR